MHRSLTVWNSPCYELVAPTSPCYYDCNSYGGFIKGILRGIRCTQEQYSSLMNPPIVNAEYWMLPMLVATTKRCFKDVIRHDKLFQHGIVDAMSISALTSKCIFYGLELRKSAV